MKGSFIKRQVSILLVCMLLLGALSFVGIKPAQAAVNWWYDAIDDGGPDDNPGQKDLNYLKIGDDSTMPGYVFVEWGWDDTYWSGANTGDACVLFDTDSDGMANYAYCISVTGTNPTTALYKNLYSCGDTSNTNCTNPWAVMSSPLTSATVQVGSAADPFSSNPAHTGNVCKATPGCLTTDTFGRVGVKLSEISTTVTPELVNVCSYPSNSPTSDPSDCVYEPGSGFLTIVKVAKPDVAADFTFSLGAGQASNDGSTNWTISGSGSEQMISFNPSLTNDLSEGTLPTGWVMESASCFIQTATPTATGTLAGQTISDIEIRSGMETICTFTNDAVVDLKVEKTDYDYTLGYAFPTGPVDYLITVTNKDMYGTYAATGVVVVDALDVNLIVSDPVTVEVKRNGVVDPLITTCTASSSTGGGTLTCDLGTMAASEVATIAFTGTIDTDTPTAYFVEYGACTQTPSDLTIPVAPAAPEPVDMCNVVTVSGTNEAVGLTGDNSASDPHDVGVPNAAEIINFAATGTVRSVNLTWETSSETDNRGFNLYRSTSVDGKKQKVNKELILSKVVPGGNLGATYQFTDKGLSPNKTYYYWIEDVNFGGVVSLYDGYVTAVPLNFGQSKK